MPYGGMRGSGAASLAAGTRPPRRSALPRSIAEDEARRLSLLPHPTYSCSLVEFDDVAVWVFDHGDPRVGQDLRLRHGELHPLFLEHRAYSTEVTDHEAQVADAELFLQTDGARRRHQVGVHELDEARAVAQPVNRTERGLHLPRPFQTQSPLVEIQTSLDIADEDQNVNRIFGRFE